MRFAVGLIIVFELAIAAVCSWVVEPAWATVFIGQACFLQLLKQEL